MRIATWNINGLRARLAFLLGWLETRRPDIVGLQELKMTDDKFPHDELEAAGYQAAVHGQKAWNGVAILAKEAPAAIRTGLPGQEEFGARLITAEVGGLCFTTVYCPNGKATVHGDYPRKLAWFDALTGHIRRTFDPQCPAVLCGDFNICPAPIDSWNEELLRGAIFHSDDERERLRDLLQWGWSDLYREKHPERQAFSWWDYRGGSFHRDQGLRIDFLLGNAAVSRRVRSVEVDRDFRKKKEGLTPSDHAPVIADLD